MKTTLALVTLVLAAATAAFASSSSALLMQGSGAVIKRAVVGDLSITADSITFDTATHQLRCAGTVELRYAGTRVTAHDCAIDLGADTTVYTLNPAGVQIQPKQDGSSSWQKPDTSPLNPPLDLKPSAAAIPARP